MTNKVSGWHYITTLLGDKVGEISFGNPSSAHSSSEHDQLFYLMYEHVQVAKESLDPHLWVYHSRITLEHLRQNLQWWNMKKKCPILHAFLQEVCVCVCVCVCYP